jgi:hypothetical protein
VKKLSVFLFLILMFVLFACGGSGPIAGVRVSGQVRDISTGAALSIAATVQSSSSTVNTSVTDGSFLVAAPRGETQLNVNPPAALGYPSFTYRFEPLNNTQNDVQTLWVGPQKVSVRGTIRNAASNDPIPNALVRFGGQFSRTTATGQFSITDVAYHPTNTAGFLGLVGQAEATNFLLNEFTSNGNLADGAGIVNVGDILLTPVDSTNPPPNPFTIWGNVLPGARAAGTIVTLRDLSNSSIVRSFTVGIDGRYQFWIGPGSYRVEASNGASVAPPQTVNLNTTTDVVRADVTLP